MSIKNSNANKQLTFDDVLIGKSAGAQTNTLTILNQSTVVS